MLHINELADKVLTKHLEKSQPMTSVKTNLSLRWIAAIFQTLSNRYLHRWDSAIAGREKEVAKEWLTRLNGLTTDQIKKGLNEWSNAWPPSCDEFKQHCLKNKITVPCYKLFKSEKLIETKAAMQLRKAVASAWLNKIKNSIQ